MSKNITIKKGGSAQSFNGTSRINVPRPDGSSANWVPEDECTLGTIEISANGTYRASELGVYGFHTAIVHVPKDNYIVGKGQDGNAYTVKVDENNKIVKTQIPTAIEITTPPTQRRYTDGEELDYTDMVVTLKNKDGTTFTDETYDDGIVPISELTLPVETAELNHRRIPVYWLSPYTSHVHKSFFWIMVSEIEEETEEESEETEE